MMLRLFYTVWRWLETLLDGGDLDRRIAEAERLCRAEAQQEVGEPAEPLSAAAWESFIADHRELLPHGGGE